MQQENNKAYKTLAIVFWILVVACMVAIFYFSSQTASESAYQSSIILDFLNRIFGEGFTDFVVRKIAHFLEFTGLCVLFNSALFFTKGKRQVILSIILTSLYAITDEVHQIFVEGRSCEFRDWCIDTLGGITGAIGFLAVFFIIKLIIDKYKKKS